MYISYGGIYVYVIYHTPTETNVMYVYVYTEYTVDLNVPVTGMVYAAVLITTFGSTGVDYSV